MLTRDEALREALDILEAALASAEGEFAMWDGHLDDPGTDDALVEVQRAFDQAEFAAEAEDLAELCWYRDRVEEAKDALANAWHALRAAYDEAGEAVTDFADEVRSRQADLDDEEEEADDEADDEGVTT